MIIPLVLFVLLSPISQANEPGVPTDIYQMRNEMQKMVRAIGNQGVSKEGKRCSLSSFIDRSKREHSMGFTFRREEGSTIYLFYAHQKFRMQKSTLQNRGMRTEFFTNGKRFLQFENMPGARESALIEVKGGHSQNCVRYFRR